MIVAWQFIAWNQSKSLTRPVGWRVIDWPRVTIAPKGYTPTMIGPKNNPSYRTLRDGLVLLPPPGNEFPGYDHVVPAGQNVVPIRGPFLCLSAAISFSHLPPITSHPSPFTPRRAWGRCFAYESKNHRETDRESDH
jgi:hypothetical protein